MKGATNFTLIFWVHGSCGPDRYLVPVIAPSKTAATKAGKETAKHEGVRFMEAVAGSVPPGAHDACEFRPFPNLRKEAA